MVIGLDVIIPEIVVNEFIYISSKIGVPFSIINFSICQFSSEFICQLKFIIIYSFNIMVKTTIILNDSIYKELIDESIERYGTAKNSP